MIFASDITQFVKEVVVHQSQSGTGVLAIGATNDTIFTGGMDGNVRMLNILDLSHTDQREGREVSALLIFRSWLFVGILQQPAGVGQDVGFVKSYNFGVVPPEISNFEIDASFPAAHRARVTSICKSNDIVFTGGEDGAVRGWKLDGKTWKLVGSLGGQTAHNFPIRKVAFINGYLYTGDFNGEIKVWRADGILHYQFQAHDKMVTDICEWSNGTANVLLTCSLDCTIKVWDLSSGVVVGECRYNYPPPSMKFRPKEIYCMITHILPDGRHVLIIGCIDGSIRILDLPDFTDLGFLGKHDRTGAITCLTLVDTGGGGILLFAGSLTGKLSCFSFK